jgi:UDP-N-acetylglucosamine 2-epimerase (non-hydrolysing)
MKLLFVVGTRPEMLKLAPVIKEAEKYFDTELVLTDQHRMVETMTMELGLRYTHNLCMPGKQPLSEMVAFILKKMPDTNADLVVVQGDTTSAMSAAMWAFQSKIPVVHIEAGLRTYDRLDPYPEEVNRRIISAIATYHYAPTRKAYGVILSERNYEDLGAWPMSVCMVGNTAIDALHMLQAQPMDFKTPTVLLTLHRRESWGQPIIQTLKGILEWLDTTDMQVVWPVHPNFAMQGMAMSFSHPRLIKQQSMSHRNFVSTLKGCRFVVTDSGGVQEEAASLGKYAVVVRKETERPEAIEEGLAVLIPPGKGIVSALNTAEKDWANVKPSDVYGDGKASERIIEHLRLCLGMA